MSDTPEHAGGEAGYFARLGRWYREGQRGRTGHGARINRALERERQLTPPEREPADIVELDYMADHAPHLLTPEQWAALGRHR